MQLPYQLFLGKLGLLRDFKTDYCVKQVKPRLAAPFTSLMRREVLFSGVVHFQKQTSAWSFPFRHWIHVVWVLPCLHCVQDRGCSGPWAGWGKSRPALGRRRSTPRKQRRSQRLVVDVKPGKAVCRMCMGRGDRADPARGST